MNKPGRIAQVIGMTGVRIAAAAILFGAAAIELAAKPPGPSPLSSASVRSADAIAKARALAVDLVKTKQIPGFAVAVGRNGTILWSEGFGLANVEQQVAATPLTRFRLGSVSKVLTAAGVARLVETGRLDLDAPVQRYVPAFPLKQWPVSTRQLAGHTGGIRHYLPEDFKGALKGAPHFDSVAGSLALFANDSLAFEPGTQYSYSSYGWNLISAVIEGASGQDFLSFMQAEVFEPLGLRSLAADHVFQIVP
ncbi:MAG TPA: serine hydrolase domain-containing protein, partial [Bryobacteraceae bacterium]|nr:serine hydrolase domain-containing protein [Bryobacteraceae bacterium]